jgi:hypothetical protein
MTGSSMNPNHLDAAAFIAIATEGAGEAERDRFYREMLAYSADGLRTIHGPVKAAEAVCSLGDQLVAGGG